MHCEDCGAFGDFETCDCVPCPNSEVCDGYMDPRMRTCMHCASRRILNSKKDILTFSDNIECPVCLECKRGVTNINCDHYVCVDCFQEMHYYFEFDNQPPFPYNKTIEEDYDNNPEKYENNPVIQNWIELCNTYNDEIDKKNDDRRNLRLCPLCRK